MTVQPVPVAPAGRSRLIRQVLATTEGRPVAGDDSLAEGPMAVVESEITYSAADAGGIAAQDLIQGLKRSNLWWGFAVFDIRQRFRRSMLGPLWLTISTGVMIGALSLVFGAIFGQPLEQILPYLSVGLILWTLISSTLIEAGTAFVAAEGYIRNVPMPISVHLYRMMARNVLAWSFNILIYVIVWLVFLRTISWEYLLLVPGLLLLVLNLVWMAFVVAVLSTRFRDIPQVVSSVVQVIFFVTPVIWSVDLLPSRPAFVEWNPMYHLLEIVRAPFLGHAPSLTTWGVALAMLPIGVPIAFLLYRRAFPRLPYWV